MRRSYAQLLRIFFITRNYAIVFKKWSTWEVILVVHLRWWRNHRLTEHQLTQTLEMKETRY